MAGNRSLLILSILSSLAVVSVDINGSGAAVERKKCILFISRGRCKIRWGVLTLIY